jgi:hypothetical protein
LDHHEYIVSSTPKRPSSRTYLPNGMSCIVSTPPLVIVTADIEPMNGHGSVGRIW